MNMDSLDDIQYTQFLLQRNKMLFHYLRELHASQNATRAPLPVFSTMDELLRHGHAIGLPQCMHSSGISKLGRSWCTGHD